jgi:hypothetical protein
MSPRTPLVHPDSYFAAHDTSPARGVAVAALVALLTVVQVAALGWVVAADTTGTVTAENPAYPGDRVCDGAEQPDGCDEPATVQRDADRVVRSSVTAAALLSVGFLVAGWLLTTGLLHAGARLAGGDGAGRDTLAVTAWGLPPATLAGIALLVVLALTFDPVHLTPRDTPAALREAVLAQVAAVDLVGTVWGVAGVAWGSAVWRSGLRHEHGLSARAATVTAAAVALLVLVAGIV